MLADPDTEAVIVLPSLRSLDTVADDPAVADRMRPIRRLRVAASDTDAVIVRIATLTRVILAVVPALADWISLTT
jgi:hypothetical protein